MNLREFLKENRNYIIVAIFTLAFFSIYSQSIKEKNNLQMLSDQFAEKNIPNYAPDLAGIEAKSFYVYDILENKSLFSKNEHLRLPLASITKLMSGLVAEEIMPDTTIITIKENDIALDSDNGLADGLIVGEKWKLKDLLNLSLMISSNGGIHAIASALNNYEAVNNKNTVDIMNGEAKKLGLNDTIFANETGLDINDGMSGAYSSAYDISMLLSYIWKNNSDLISNTNKSHEVFISESNIKHIAENTNISINDIPGIISSKTGFTNLAGGNLAVVFDAGFMHPVAIVVLGSSTDGRFSDVIKLAKISLEKLSE